MLLTDPTQIDLAAFEQRTGWAIKPEGACKGDVCVPLPENPPSAHVLSERLGMPLVHDSEHGVYSLGPETAVTGRALTTAELPDIELPDVDGKPFRLRSLRGHKVLIVTWASW